MAVAEYAAGGEERERGDRWLRRHRGIGVYGRGKNIYHNSKRLYLCRCKSITY